MDFVPQLWDRLISWLGQGQNASGATVILTCVLVLITGWYALLTGRMARSVARQTTGMLQPVLRLQINYSGGEFAPAGELWVMNVGAQPIVLLDVSLSLFPPGHTTPVVRTFPGVDDQVVFAGSDIKLPFDFRDKLPDNIIQWHAYSYQFIVVASDLSRQVAAVYEHLPVLGTTTCRLGVPLRVRLKYAVRPSLWRYYRFVGAIPGRRLNSGRKSN